MQSVLQFTLLCSLFVHGAARCTFYDWKLLPTKTKCLSSDISKKLSFQRKWNLLNSQQKHLRENMTTNDGFNWYDSIHQPFWDYSYQSFSLVASPEIQKKKWTECQKYITHFCECFFDTDTWSMKIGQKDLGSPQKGSWGLGGSFAAVAVKENSPLWWPHCVTRKNVPKPTTSQNISTFWRCVTHILPAHAGESEPFTNTAYFSVHSLCCTFHCSPTLIKRWKWSRRPA